MEGSSRSSSLADEVVDEILPEGLEWQRLVRTYPWPALLLAAAGGFVLGRSRGPAVLAALGGFAASQVARGVNDLLGDEVI
jgi:hypothetical protein